MELTFIVFWVTLFVVLSNNFNFADSPVIGSANTEEQNKNKYK